MPQFFFQRIPRRHSRADAVKKLLSLLIENTARHRVAVFLFNHTTKSAGFPLSDHLQYPFRRFKVKLSTVGNALHHPQLNLIGLLHRPLNLLQLKQSQHKNRDDGRIAKHPNEVVAKGVRLHHLFRRKIRKIKNRIVGNPGLTRH